MDLTLDLGAIIAVSLAITSYVADLLRIPKRLRAWVSLLLIVLLNMGNEWLFAPDTFAWRPALREGIMAGLTAVGIYSTSKNTVQQVTEKLNGNGKHPQAPDSPDNSQ